LAALSRNTQMANVLMGSLLHGMRVRNQADMGLKLFFAKRQLNKCWETGMMMTMNTEMVMSNNDNENEQKTQKKNSNNNQPANARSHAEQELR